MTSGPAWKRRLEGLPPQHRAMLAAALSCAVVGDPQAVRAGIQAFADRTGADELIITCSTFDPQARLRSYEIVAEATGRVSV